MTIESFLESKGFTVLDTGDGLPPDNTLDMISLLLCFQYPFLRQWLWDIRKRNVRKNRTFSTNLNGSDKNHAAMIRNLCYMLQKNGLFEEYSFDKSGNRARGVVADDERALGFLTGGWLERCVKVCIDGFLNLDRERFECALNTEVIRPRGRDGKRRKFELDILLRIDERIYWWEAKSGQYREDQLQRYSEVAGELGLPRKNCYLILAEHERGTHFGQLGKKIGFKIIRPQDIPRTVEEIEDGARK